jgi:hypothetical protein
MNTLETLWNVVLAGSARASVLIAAVLLLRWLTRRWVPAQYNGGQCSKIDTRCEAEQPRASWPAAFASNIPEHSITSWRGEAA